jgi:hypothetical protein
MSDADTERTGASYLQGMTNSCGRALAQALRETSRHRFLSGIFLGSALENSSLEDSKMWN